MTFYRYDQNSTIDGIVVRKSSGGRVRTMLFADNPITSAQVSQIKKLVTNNGWQYVVSESDGRPCLEVCGVKNIDQIETILRDAHLVHGTRSINEKDNPKYTLMDKIRHNRLKIYGILSIVADAGFLGYGILKQKISKDKHDWEDTASAVAYSAGSLSFLFFGAGDKTVHQLHDISVRLKQKMEFDGLTTPAQSTLESFTLAKQNASGSQKRLNFFSRHPAEIGNGFTALAGGLLAKGAIKNHNIQDGILGATTLASGSAAALIKEKPKNPTEPPPQGMWQKTWYWIKEKPNRVAGYGYMISTLMHAGESIHVLHKVGTKYPNNRGTAIVAYSGRLIFGGLNVIAELLLSVASKGGEKLPQREGALEEGAYSMVADVILSQPIADRERLIKDFSMNFLAHSSVLGGNPVLIKETLEKRVESLQHNLWSTFKVINEEPAVTSSQPSISAADRIAARRAAAAQEGPSLAF